MRKSTKGRRESPHIQTKGKAIMKAIRAKKGGEVGINGFDYKGGQYLPSSALTMKGLKSWSSSYEVQPVIEKPKPTLSNADELIEKLKPMIQNLQIPNLRRPGGEHFSASYILRNFRVSSEAKEILIKLSVLG